MRGPPWNPPMCHPPMCPPPMWNPPMCPPPMCPPPPLASAAMGNIEIMSSARAAPPRAASLLAMAFLRALAWPPASGAILVQTQAAPNSDREYLPKGGSECVMRPASASASTHHTARRGWRWRLALMPAQGPQFGDCAPRSVVNREHRVSSGLSSRRHRRCSGSTSRGCRWRRHFASANSSCSHSHRDNSHSRRNLGRRRMRADDGIACHGIARRGNARRANPCGLHRSSARTYGGHSCGHRPRRSCGHRPTRRPCCHRRIRHLRAHLRLSREPT
jgi:hypothetical protein